MVHSYLSKNDTSGITGKKNPAKVNEMNDIKKTSKESVREEIEGNAVKRKEYKRGNSNAIK
jgi:hypothetical protein